MSRKRVLVLLLSIVAALTAGCDGINSTKESSTKHVKQELKKVMSADKLRDSYDVIIVGTDPEGIAAAVSAARNGQRTLLIESRNREVLGGLMTVGWLNSIDMNWDKTKEPPSGKEREHLNKGIFTEWYEKIEGHSFDVATAANAFYDMVRAESNLDLFMKAASIEPLVQKNGESALIEGIAVKKPDGTKQKVTAKTVIDATQDADIAAAAGAAFTIGREDLGDPESRMAATAVFRLKNIDDKAWGLIEKRLNGDDRTDTGVSGPSAFGYGDEMKGYEPLDKQRAKMRGLNIGRQADGTILINALQLFGIDGLDEASRREGLAYAAKEIPNVVNYLRQFDEFKNAELDAIAPELYIRETRHLLGLYRLSVIDLLENRDQWDRIAFGSYVADIQSTSPSNGGFVVVDPIQYTIPFRSLVPRQVDGLLVVGRSASYDTLAHGSARVIPTGMAEGQAAGAAAKLAEERKVTFRELAESKPLVAELQKRLNDQGMDLKPFRVEPQDFMKQKTYPGLKTAVFMGFAQGSYGNSGFNMDKPSNPQRLVNHMSHIKKKFKDAFQGGDLSAVTDMYENPAEADLTLEQAGWTIARTLGWDIDAKNAVVQLRAKEHVSQESIDLIADQKRLTDGEVFMLLKDVLEAAAELRL